MEQIPDYDTIRQDQIPDYDTIRQDINIPDNSQSPQYVLVHAFRDNSPQQIKCFRQKSQFSASVVEIQNNGESFKMGKHFACWGLILSVPQSSIERMLPKAGGTNADGLISTLGGKKDPGVSTLQELIEQTPNNSFNEVIVTQGNKIKPIAVFYNACPDGTAEREESFLAAQNLAQQMQLPLLPVMPLHTREREITKGETTFPYLSMETNGKTLYIRLDPNPVDRRFWTTTSSTIAEMKPEEFEIMIKKAEERFPEETRALNLREQYKKEWQEYAKSRTSQKSVSHTESTPKPKTYT